MLLFVYGTLKRGGRLHHHLKSRGAIYLNDMTLDDHQLVKTSSWFPAIRPMEGSQVHGELFKIDKAALAHIDYIEGAPALFKRQETDDHVHFYVGASENLFLGCEPIESGVWEVNQ